ncbi:MAG: DedA family protein [Nanoarchaeota archaeon]
MVQDFFSIFFHLDVYLSTVTALYGFWVYVLLFVIIFIETGFIFMPFLPGDSLLFAAGALASLDSLNVMILIIILSIAAILGDSINYYFGRQWGPRIFKKDDGMFFNKQHLTTTRQFYEMYGAETIVIARFIPIVRSFAPFVAGIGRMQYITFLSYNIVGGIVWVSLFVGIGYLFGNLPFVKENFSLVIIGIILTSFIPVIIQFIREKKAPSWTGKF